MTTHENFYRRIRSFVRRDSRMTDAQKRAYQAALPQFGLQREAGLISFERNVPKILEIGFGSGTSLVAMACAEPMQDFIGIETHLPGIGNLFLQVEAQKITNLRIYYADAVPVLQECIPDQCFDTIQIFFPDPWQKRRHHKRRLIQPDFVNLLAQKLKVDGTLHLATDWADYAKHMMKVLTDAPGFVNTAGNGHYAERSQQRPLVTKFELRGQKAGRVIYELKFKKGDT